MCEQVSELVSALRRFVTSLDLSLVSGTDAARLVEVASEGERLCAALRTMAAGRVADSGEWRASGHRTPAQWIASRTQGTLSQAITTLWTAKQLADQPAVREAFVSGRLSEVQTAEISAVAAADPSAESALLALAAQETVAELKERCRQVRSAVAGDEDAAERIRRGRYLRNWIDRDGAVRLDARLAPDDGAPLNAVIETGAMRLQEEARRSGQREPTDAYRADALVALAGGGASKAVAQSTWTRPRSNEDAPNRARRAGSPVWAASR